MFTSAVTAKGTGPQGRSRRGRDSTHRRPCGTSPQSGTPCDRSAQGSKSWHSGSFAKYADIGLVTISFPACCVLHRTTGLPVMDHDMHTKRRRPDYLQACPKEPPVDGVKSALTPALWPCTFCSDPTSAPMQLIPEPKNLVRSCVRSCGTRAELVLVARSCMTLVRRYLSLRSCCQVLGTPFFQYYFPSTGTENIIYVHIR